MGHDVRDERKNGFGGSNQYAEVQPFVVSANPRNLLYSFLQFTSSSKPDQASVNHSTKFPPATEMREKPD